MKTLCLLVELGGVVALAIGVGLVWYGRRRGNGSLDTRYIFLDPRSSLLIGGAILVVAGHFAAQLT